MMRLKSHPGGGKSLSKMQNRKMSDTDHQRKIESRKSFSDSFAPSQGCPLASFPCSDSGIYCISGYIMYHLTVLLSRAYNSIKHSFPQVARTSVFHE